MSSEQIASRPHAIRIQIYGRLSDKGFDDLLCVLRKLLPNHNELLEKIYLTKQMICPMGLEAKKIYACTNNCILCRRDKYKDLDA